jgi:hypothetical protein
MAINIPIFTFQMHHFYNISSSKISHLNISPDKKPGYRKKVNVLHGLHVFIFKLDKGMRYM